MRGRERQKEKRRQRGTEKETETETKTEAEAERMHSVVIVECQEIKKMSYNLIYSLFLHREVFS